MKQFYADPQEIETSGNDSSDRLAELADQCWDRGKSLALAVSEGMDFNDKHWEVMYVMAAARARVWSLGVADFLPGTGGE